MSEQPFPIHQTHLSPAAPVTTKPVSASASRLSPIFWLLACLLLATAQVIWAGYQLGVGNQTIQVPFLKKASNPDLYPRDAMVNETLENYPSYFFRVLGKLVSADQFESAYFFLHLLTAFGVLAASYALAWAMFKDHLASLITVLLLVAGHHRALAGDTLYWAGFTHTWAVFPLAVAALALFYRNRVGAAFALAGILFNFHALMAAHLGFLIGFSAFFQIRRLGWRQTLVGFFLFVIAASPTLANMMMHRQSFGEDWLALAHIRASQQLFASSWWRAGHTDIPRFALLVGLGVMALSFTPPSEERRKTILLAVAAMILLAAGFIFSEWLPLASVVRAQLYRVSVLCLILALANIAFGIASGWRWAITSSASIMRRILEFGCATIVLACVAMPALLPSLPAAFVLCVAVALINGRLSKMQAVVAGVVILICLAAARTISFHWWGVGDWMPSSFSLSMLPWLWAGALGSGLALWAAQFLVSKPTRSIFLVSGAVILVGIASAAFPIIERAAVRDDPWRDVQRWAREQTPQDALFLTPTERGGFRIHSQRSVVGEWRDGTQLFFSASFAQTWWERMTSLREGMLYDSGGKQQLSPGKLLAQLGDAELLDLAEKYGATHIVLPVGGHRDLTRTYENDEWAVYLPELASGAAPPSQVMDKERWEAQQQFMREVVYPNIEKHRKSAARVQIVDENGRPVYDLTYEIQMTRHAFQFACSLHFFVYPQGQSFNDFKPPAVKEVELERFLELFNSTMIPYSGKWIYVEAEEGKRFYDDLDQYVDWCAKHGIEIEYHFLNGYLPGWLRNRPPDEQGTRFLGHARDLVMRYGDRVKSWQVINEHNLIQYSPAVFREIRRLVPDAKLGISACAKFTSSRPSPQRERDMLVGIDDVRWLKSKGVELDYFGFHGHRPFGVWFDPREMYEALDAFAKEVPKIRISEFATPLGGEIQGHVSRGRWTAETQAEFYAYIFTVCFSHPAVEMINLWQLGPIGWQRDAGLLDQNYEPKPAFNALKELIHDKWRTRLSGQLGLDGVVTFRGFHGTYEIALKLPNGETARANFLVKPDSTNSIRLRLNRITNKLGTL